MPLPVYDSLDAVPEADREDFAEHEGKWRHKAEIETATERKKRAKLLDEKKEEERKRLDAEKRLAELEQAADARSKGISDEELRKIQEREAAARKPLEDKIAALEATNRKLSLTDRVKALALGAGVMPDRIKQAMKILDDRTDLTDEGGIVVKDEDGNVTTETITDFLGKSFKKESPWFYAGNGSSGSGAGGSNGSGGGGDQSPAPTRDAIAAKRSQVAGTF